MKKRIIVLLTAVLILTGCESTSASAGTPAPAETAKETVTDTQSEAVGTETVSEEQTEAEGTQAAANAGGSQTEHTSDTLVIYFSRTGEQYTVGVIEKGNTAIVAEMIAEKTGAELFEVLPADDHYPMTYEALTDVAKQEQNDQARPAYSGELPDLGSYSTIFIGAPVWWGDWPMIMYTLFETADFSGKQLIPFSTHEGSGLAGFDKKLQTACPDADVLKGLAIRGNDAQNAQEKVRESVGSWLTELGF